MLVPALNENLEDKIYVFEKTTELLSTVMDREITCKLNEYFIFFKESFYAFFAAFITVFFAVFLRFSAHF